MGALHIPSKAVLVPLQVPVHPSIPSFPKTAFFYLRIMVQPQG